MKQMILEFLQSHCIGRANAKPKSKIMKELGLIDERTFRTAIHALRIENYPILSACEFPAGYFLPANMDEVEEVMRQFKNRTINQNKACAGIRRGLEELFPGQQIHLDINLIA